MKSRYSAVVASGKAVRYQSVRIEFGMPPVLFSLEKLQSNGRILTLNALPRDASPKKRGVSGETAGHSRKNTLYGEPTLHSTFPSDVCCQGHGVQLNVVEENLTKTDSDLGNRSDRCSR